MTRVLKCGALLLMACGPGVMVEARDASSETAATSVDASVDAGVADDSGVVDAGTGDDAGAPDASVADAGGADASWDSGVAADAGPVRCGAGWACETFDAPDAAAWVDGPFRRYGTSDAGRLLVTTPPQGNTSRGALRVELHGIIGGNAMVELRDAGAVLPPSYHVFGRARIWGDQLPGATESKRHGWVSLSGTSPMYGTGLAISTRHDSGRKLYMNYFVNPPWQDCWGNGSAPAQPMPVHQWVCYEFEYDSTTSTVRVWYDEVLQLELSGRGTGCSDGMAARPWQFPLAPTLRIGLFQYDVAPMSGWIDDIAIGPSRVGCRP